MDTKEEKEEKTDVVEEKVELDGEALKAISDKVAEQMKADMAGVAKEAAEKAAEAVLAKLETVDKKAVVDGEAKEGADKGTTEKLGTIKVKAFDSAGGDIGEIEVESKFAHESKEMRLLKAARALVTGDILSLEEYKKDALAVREKSGYANETTDADGAVLVPYPDFDTTVHENLPKYGVAAANATIRTVAGNEVKQIGLSAGLSFVETAEAGSKSGGKLTLTSATKTLKKYALIVAATDELTEDAAIDFWALVTREMARALAKKQDEITFTDATYGITETTGVITEPVSGAGTTIAWEDLLNAENAIEDGIDSSSYKWFMRRETWNRLIQLKGTTNDHFIAGSLNTAAGWVPNNNNPATPWGTPIVFTRVLNTSVTVPNPGVMAVYGDLSYYTLYTKRGMVVTALREATVTDADGSSLNLALKDATALRFVVRMMGFLNSNDASRFVLVGVGTVS
jgi:HK97 family phage major capsid protein